MALLEGDKHSKMPVMSWNSVVGKQTANERKRTTEVGGADADDDHDDDRVEPLTSGTPPEPATALVTPSILASSDPPVMSAPQLSDRLDRPAPPIPDAPHSPDPVPESLPEIVEATPPDFASPVAPIAPIAPIAPVAPQSSTIEPTAVHASVIAAPSHVAEHTPVVPTATQPNQTLSLPSVAAAIPSAMHQVVEPTKQTPRKDRSGSIARVGFFFLVVAALASAAVIFGRPYLFPAEWEGNSFDFAEPIELARGTDFIEPVMLTPQPTETHRSMVVAQLLGDPASELPMWRSLGLAGPDSADDAILQELISEQSPVLYSSLDGQVYYDEAFTRPDRSALILRALATAALDQEFSFSADLENRGLDDAALTEAHVRQQAALIQQTASDSTPLPTPDMAALAYLPAVLDYRLTAPAVFVDLLRPVDDATANPLTDIGTAGPGPLRVPPLAQLTSTSPLPADTPDGAAVVTDRSFWYLAFAGHLDATTAYRMSTQLQGAGLQMVTGPTGTCAVAAFTTVDEATNATLQAALDTWVAATAPELGATVTTLPDNTVQLRSCDPTGAYTSNMRFGGARQLIAWRGIELAVTNSVIAHGGTVEDIDAAIARIGETPTAVAVARLPAGTPAAELAAAARAAAADVLGEA